MQTLDRAVRVKGVVGQRLQLPWPSVSNLVKMHTKEIVIVGGAPGSGKSLIAINLAMAVDYPVLYIAQDTPASVVARMVSIEKGWDLEKSMKELYSGKAADELSAVMREKHSNIMIERRPVNVERIENMLSAIEEWQGKTPPLVVVDNLIDMRVEGSTHADMSFFTKTLPELKFLANEKNTCIMLLHHVVRRGENSSAGRGTAPLTLNDLYFAGEREARLVLGVWNNGQDALHLQVLKQQDGASSADGNIQVDLKWTPRLARLEDFDYSGRPHVKAEEVAVF